MRCELSVRFASVNFSDVSNIDHRLRESKEHAGSITVPYRRLPVTERVALPPNAGEASCLKPIVIPSHPFGDARTSDMQFGQVRFRGQYRHPISRASRPFLTPNVHPAESALV